MESIEDFEEKGKPLPRFLENPYFTVILVVLVAVSAFALGRISALKGSREPVRVISSSGLEVSPPPVQSSSAKALEGQGGEVFNTAAAVVGSKNGTKYHLSTCPGAKQISAKNLITFASVEEARAKGYTAASNCPGLK